MITRPPPINYKCMPEELKKRIESGNDKVTVRLNKDERAILEITKRTLAVDRDSTALKELALLGYYNVLHDTYFSELVPKIAARIKRGIYDSVILNQEKMGDLSDKETENVAHLKD